MISEHAALWGGLISRGVTLEREHLSGRVVAIFDCPVCACLGRCAWLYLDTGEGGCLACGAVLNREAIMDLMAIGPRREVDGHAGW